MNVDTIYTGNALELIHEIEDNSVDLVLWDPDYGVGMDYGNKIISGDEAIDFIVKMLPVLRQKSKNGQAVIFWSGSIQRVKAFLASEIDTIWPVHYMGIWHKTNGAGPTGNGLARRFETWFWLKDGVKSRNTEWHALPDVLTEPRVVPGHKEAVAHPSQKPVRLLERLIRFFTLPGDIVLDPTIGSGSVAVAAKLTQRHFIGFELNPEYANMARKRVFDAPDVLPFVYEDSYQGKLFEGIETQQNKRFAPDLERQAETIIAEN